MSTAQQENARTLAAALGSTEIEAERLLNATALITCGADGERLAGYIESMLARTLSIVRRDLTDNPAVEVVVGLASPRSQAKKIFVGLDGYCLEVRAAPSAQLAAQSRPIIELIAACYAAAAAVHHALDVEFTVPLRLPIVADLAELYGSEISRLDERIELGVCFLAGAGAIGNSVIAGLSMLDVHGQINICDPDHVSEGNLNRCWWFGPEDLHKSKAERLMLHAQPFMPGIELVPHVGTLRDTIKKLGEPPIETLLIGVDSRRARRNLQNEMPHRVFDASTSGITEFVLHFNELPALSACMSCIYYEAADESSHENHVADTLGVSVTEVRANYVSASTAVAIARRYPHLDPVRVVGLAYDSLFKELCGKGEFKASTADRVLAPFGFVSVLAGVMLAIEIAIRTGKRSSRPFYNYWRLSPWGPPLTRMREQREKHPRCEFCSNYTLQSVVRDLWG